MKISKILTPHKPAYFCICACRGSIEIISAPSPTLRLVCISSYYHACSWINLYTELVLRGINRFLVPASVEICFHFPLRNEYCK